MRKPTTGIAGCCALAANGQAAAAPPKSVMNSRRFMATSKLRRRHLTGSKSTSIGIETGIKTIAAVRNRCPLWVKSGQTIADRSQFLSVVAPIAAKMVQRRECSEVPKADNCTSGSFAV